ncbi:uncharacterized protein DMAD_10822 [Drosophila madeirensis]|uniref:Uncharacterized protein n=1 Tax=Drosophila madeirensis TaxID=30013 RepID=A0AAU9FAW5_DROMD
MLRFGDLPLPASLPLCWGSSKWFFLSLSEIISLRQRKRFSHKTRIVSHRSATAWPSHWSPPVLTPPCVRSM